LSFLYNLRVLVEPVVMTMKWNGFWNCCISNLINPFLFVFVKVKSATKRKRDFADLATMAKSWVNTIVPSIEAGDSAR